MLNSYKGYFFKKLFIGLLFGLSIVLSSIGFNSKANAFDVPRLRGAVNDYAGLLSNKESNSIEVFLRNLSQKGGAQISILVVDSLAGEPIEQASIAVMDAWKLGSAEKDNGLLVLLAKKERKVRIEVGQGLEGNVTDAYSKRIIDEVMRPMFKEGEFAKGLYFGVVQIAKYANPEIDLAGLGNRKTNWQKKRRRKKSSSWVTIIFIIIFLIGGRGRSGGLLTGMLLGGVLGGGRSSGGFGGGSSGGFGGFSGGGGGFSGGGASGDW